MPVALAAATLLGLAIGSFLNVVIYRIPARVSLSSPPSRCPLCEHPIRARHNIPVVGWLFLRGRCADCDAPISPRYPLVELATCALFVAMTIRLHQLHVLGALPAYLAFTAIAVSLAMIDVDVHRLPDAIVLPSYPLLALLLTIGAVIDDSPGALLRALIGGVALYALYLALALSYPAGMGFGDVKLAGIVGGMLAYVSYPALLVGGFLAFVLGGMLGIAVMAAKRASGKTHIPFGPFMLGGALISMFCSTQVWSFYTDLVFRT